MAISYPVWDSAMFAYTISSHILFVTLSMALAITITIAEFLALRKKDKYYDTLAYKLSKGLVIFFAVGTASGTVMAMELFLFWPNFMKIVGQVSIGPFYVEVFSFLLEAIALPMYVYFWKDFKNRWEHWALSLAVTIGTYLSAFTVTEINAWMNTPNGFNVKYYLLHNKIIDVNPLAPFWTPSTFAEELHMSGAVYYAGIVVILGYLAYKYLKTSNMSEKMVYRRGINITAVFAILDIIYLGATGSNELSTLLVIEPLKYAALEQDMVPVTYGAPEHIFGVIINGHPAYYVNLPLAQSLLAYPFTFGHGYIPGLSSYPSSVWPPSFVHDTLDLMVGFGILMGFFWLIVVIMYFMKKDPLSRPLILKLTMAVAVLGVLTMEDGWYTAEVGRVPFIIKAPVGGTGIPGVYGVMTIGQAASTSPVVFPLGIAIIIFYIVLLPLTFYYAFKVMKLSNIDDDLKMAEEDIKIEEERKNRGVPAKAGMR
ncbi:cytochrome ubiquinol oxidase subunit I [Picrophilus oshimae]|uniref:Cytochrome d ubiquinol oxidase subunit I n=1 Tax=Picrophilus torridus (strain ATCC 700027 / DSM 9790 / JCM 10055 / NBRC 100828 / KAW 2/3) TaxID=1122961 RepID=Q6L1F8_PICTO|nr:cytochrome ubiquinol oxidase subunit I [Picrophilus oshimae]AAT43194.1 cytochrome d ubiquinol oxidase subunit I [Picrophilus oshimae DSM 9789]